MTHDYSAARKWFTRLETEREVLYDYDYRDAILVALEIAEKLKKPIAAKTLIKPIEFDGQKLVVLNEWFYNEIIEALNDRPD